MQSGEDWTDAQRTKFPGGADAAGCAARGEVFRGDPQVHGGAHMGDHHKDFMHVSPKLGPLRQAVHESQYEEIFANFIYQKLKIG
jgi:hypothetical protein